MLSGYCKIIEKKAATQAQRIVAKAIRDHCNVTYWKKMMLKVSQCARTIQRYHRRWCCVLQARQILIEKYLKAAHQKTRAKPTASLEKGKKKKYAKTSDNDEAKHKAQIQEFSDMLIKLEKDEYVQFNITYSLVISFNL